MAEMRQLHAYIVALKGVHSDANDPGGGAGHLRVGRSPRVSAWSVPGDCPPFCDRIPDSAWIAPTSIPLYSAYRWPGLAGLAVTAPAPRFKFEDICASPPVADDARSYAVAARAVVPKPDGQWQLQVQVMHWRGETWRGAQTRRWPPSTPR